MKVEKDRYMKNIKKTTSTLYVLFLMITGCNTEKCNPLKEVVIGQKNNRELHKIVDGCENDRLVSELEYIKISKDSIVPDGYYKEYYSNGKLKVLSFAKLGIQDSVCIVFSENGNKISESFKSDGSFIGPQKEYNSNGSNKSIVYYKNDTAKWFGIEFDTRGNIIKLHGKSLRTVTTPRYEIQKKGERFAAIFEVPLLGNINTELKIVVNKNDQIVYDTTISTFTHNKANFDYYPYFIDLESSGKYELIASVRLTDKKNRKLITEDSTHLPFTVK
jgi:hypothetical protein